MCRSLRPLLITSIAANVLGLSSLSASIQFFGPLPYLSEADSPFAASIGQPGFYLENFEDLSLNTPGVTASTGAPFGPGGITDSVDGDDGNIDGSGQGGASFFSGGGSTGITFTFNPGTLGGLPTAAGIVWTDSGFGATVNFSAFDGSGTLIGSLQAISQGDNSNSGTTAEDVFFGLFSTNGIGSIFISNTSGGIEVDHLQYGAVPEPQTAALCLGLAAIAGAICYRRRRG